MNFNKVEYEFKTFYRDENGDCKFVTEYEAINKGYPYVKGNSPREYWENMMKGKAIVWK